MKLSYVLAGVIALSAAGWVFSGESARRLVKGEARPAPTAISVAERIKLQGEDTDGVKLTAVRTRISKSSQLINKVVVRGRTEALRKIVLKPGIKGRIVSINMREGQKVKKGDVLVRIEENELRARLAEAKAFARQRKLEYNAARKLGRKGYRADTQIAAAAAQMDAAKAYVKQINVALSKTAIRAPFDAIVDEQYAEIGDYLAETNPIARLIDQDPFLVTAQVSEQEIGRLSVGAPGSAQLGDGRKVVGKIRFIANEADPSTRTFRVELEVPNPDGQLRDGLSAELHFPTGILYAHLITPAILTLNDEGLLGVRCVGKDMRVSFYPVKIVATTSQGVWISGLPEEVNLITVGAEFVRHGDKVRTSRPGKPGKKAAGDA